MLATWVWDAWWPVGAVRFSWGGLGVLASAHAIWMVAKAGFEAPAEDGGELSEAQDEYLRGNWFEAEALALRVLERDPNDIAAGLLLVGVLRATQRYDAALTRLHQLELLDAAAAWWFEIGRERQRIEQAREAGASRGESEAT